MFRLLLWGFIFYFIYRLVTAGRRVRSGPRPPGPPLWEQPKPPTPPAPFKNVQDAEFEELPPDPPKK